MHVYQWEESWGKGEGEPKINPTRLSLLALDLTNLKYNGILTVDLFKIQFNSEWRIEIVKSNLMPDHEMT